MENLYSISSKIAEFLENGFFSEFVDEETGEIDLEKCQCAFEKLNLDFNESIENLSLYYKQIMADSELIKAEMDRLSDRKKAKERRAESLKQFILNNLNFLNKSKFESPKVVVKTTKGVSTEVYDFDLLDKAFKIEKVEVKADKTAIKNAIKEGKEVPGARLIETQGLSIK